MGDQNGTNRAEVSENNESGGDPKDTEAKTASPPFWKYWSPAVVLLLIAGLSVYQIWPSSNESIDKILQGGECVMGAGHVEAMQPGAIAADLSMKNGAAGQSRLRDENEADAKSAHLSGVMGWVATMYIAELLFKFGILVVLLRVCMRLLLEWWEQIY